MARKVNSFNGVPTGALTTGTSDDGGEDVFQAIEVSSGSITVATSANLSTASDRGLVCDVTANNGYARTRWDLTSSTDGYIRFYFKTHSANPSTTVRMCSAYATTTVRWQIRLNTSNILEFTDGAGVVIRNTSALSTSTVYRVEARIVADDASIVLNVYAGEGTTPLSTSSFAGTDISAWDRLSFGYIAGSSFVTWDPNIACVGWSDTAYLGPAGAASGSGSLTLDASAVQSSVGSGSLTLSGSAVQSSVGSGSLTLAGSAVQSSVATGSLSLSGSGSWTAVATGALTLSGSAVHSSSAAGSLSLSGSAVHSSIASGSLDLSASADWTAVAAGSLTLAASATTTAVATGSLSLSAAGDWTAIAAGSLSLSGSGTGGVPASADGSLSLSADASAAASPTAAGSLSLDASGLATAGGAAGSLTLAASAAASGSPTAAGSLSLSAAGGADASPSATASLDLAAAAGAASGNGVGGASLDLSAADAAASAGSVASGSLDLSGAAGATLSAAGVAALVLLAEALAIETYAPFGRARAFSPSADSAVSFGRPRRIVTTPL